MLELPATLDGAESNSEPQELVADARRLPSSVTVAASALSETAYSSKFGGAGFGDAERNRLVEAAGMELVTSFYAADGWAVSDVSAAKCGWDITCTKLSEELHVEVKGISGSSVAFILTADEHDTAVVDPSWRSAAVTDALSPAPRVTVLTGAEVVGGARPFAYQVRVATA